MRNIRDAMISIRKYPQFQHLPLVIGESDPEGCAACGMNTNPENAYRNGTMYSSYTAASFAREYLLADSFKLNLMGAVSWSFEFENQPWFAGFRDLATNGVDKPVLNVFRMFGMMKGKRVEVNGNRMYSLSNFVDSSVRGYNDIGGLASSDKNSAAILVWNYHDEDKTGTSDTIAMNIRGLPLHLHFLLTEYRIDDIHSNSYSLWKQMGSPQQPTQSQIKQLENAGQLQKAGAPGECLANNDGKFQLNIVLPRQGVSLLKLDYGK